MTQYKISYDKIILLYTILQYIISGKTDLSLSGWRYTYPSEKYESHLGWWHSQLNGKIKFMFQTTNQLLLFTANLVKLNRYTNNIPTYIHTSNMINIIQLHTLGLQFQWLMHKHSCRDHIPTYVFFWSHCEPQQHPQATAYLRIINTILQVYYYKLYNYYRFISCSAMLVGFDPIFIIDWWFPTSFLSQAMVTDGFLDFRDAGSQGAAHLR